MIPDSHGYFESKMKVPLFYGLTTLLLWSPVLTQIVDEQTSFGPPKHGQGIYWFYAKLNICIHHFYEDGRDGEVSRGSRKYFNCRKVFKNPSNYFWSTDWTVFLFLGDVKNVKNLLKTVKGQRNMDLPFF